ncbi:hypothetical protein SAMN05216503_2890 [Polaribacter sp. KT25b]|uniref:tetratricopeptide repeat protein n=1 Tax=Polaribacter sp. KT25b TaxID=1855336 RepID=UPI00087951FD|nr:hypothetical protein [Polaribacter sp. KT25b]SDS38405.1 hypothetical protein SAMN05216503_2890 [Polaribacter sp. KT25b]
MIIREKNKDKRIRRIFVSKRSFLFSLFFMLLSTNFFSQDSIPEKEDLTEETELKFQQFFFRALSEKSIGNYKKAIENLESCNQILSNDVAVFFEFSKNYLFLKNTLLAKEYIERSLAKEPNNIWMLTHLVQIYIKDRNFEEAINTQHKIVAINPKKREFLVRLYVYNSQIREAFSLMDSLEKENVLSSSLKRLRNRLEVRKEYLTKKNLVQKDVKEEGSSIGLNELINQFKTDKSYKILEDILNKSTGNYKNLLKFSEEGIALFPAQPFLYLINGKVLNDTKNHKNALPVLQSGIDFVIDNEMEVDFYLEIAKAFKGLGNDKEKIKYLQKAKNLKNK